MRTTGTRRFGRCVLYPCLSAALLVSCYQHSYAPITMPTLVKPSPNPSFTRSVPTAPGSYAPSTPEGAAAFARYWYSQLAAAFLSRNPEMVRRLSSQECRACARYIASISGLRDRNETVVGVLYIIKLAEAPGVPGPDFRVDIIFDAPATHTFDAAGREIASEPEVRGYQEQLTLVRNKDTWLVKREQHL